MQLVKLSASTSNRLALNAVANVVQMLAGSMLLFVLYRFINGTLGVAQLGVWSVVVATVSASRLADMGLGAGITRFVARDCGTGDQLRAAQVADTGMITLAVAVGALLPLFHLVAGKGIPLFFQGEYLEQAQTILPLALVSLWLTIVGGVSQGGLDGAQCMGLRAVLVLAGQLVLLLMAIWLVPAYGIEGLAWAQIGQGVFLTVVGRLLLRATMPYVSFLPWRWKWPVLREMLGYGVKLQASTFFILLFDPVTKALMARFGGPSAAGYFEMANQVVLKVRSVIVAANQAIVPHVANWAERGGANEARFYAGNIRILVFVTLPVMALLATAGPLASWLLVGDYRSEFVSYLLVLSLAWGVNVFGSPAYFINQGTGNVGANTLAHAATGFVSAILGALLGWRFGASGVLAGYVIGLVFGTFWLIGMFKRRHHGSLNMTGLEEHAWLLVGTVVAAAWAATMVTFPALARLSVVSFGLLLVVALLGSAMWFHKLRAEYWARLYKLKAGAA